jgi:starch synthase
MSAVIPLYVKTAYHDEPQFANTKIVTSLFSDQPKGNLGTNFKQCLEFRDAKSELIEKYGEKFDFIELGKLAIDYSDGIVQTSKKVNADLIRYAKDNNKTILTHPAEDEIADKYTTFYNSILEG